MSKTETQTPAEKLAREYRPTMPADVLHLWAADVVAALRRLDAENKALRADAERWREIRGINGNTVRVVDVEKSSSLFEEHADQAIDTAMAAAKNGGAA